MPIAIKVKLFGALRGAREREVGLTLDGGATVADALRALGLSARVDIWALVDGERAPLDRALRDGACVELFQPVGGGR